MRKETRCSIRPMTGPDKNPVLRILEKTGMFTPEEIEVALELIDLWLSKPEQKDYIIRAADHEGEVAGYVCYGPTPAAEGTFDLYWTAVDPAFQGRGIGKELLIHTEEAVRSSGGRLLIIETSSREIYGPTRGFYEGNGYKVEARIKDFYRPGDDRLIFTRRLDT